MMEVYGHVVLMKVANLDAKSLEVRSILSCLNKYQICLGLSKFLRLSMCGYSRKMVIFLYGVQTKTAN